ncbi:MAG: lipopolysaccharide biosynthesis protein [Planctomycetales bacterium]|nr:lipopolysaccharide biosynthesis protein [Planctomycetales bacterium]
MSRSRRFAWYVVTQWFAALVNAGVAIALVPFLQRQLGDSGYGLSVLLLTITNISLIAELGVSVALGRHMAEQVALGRNDEMNRLHSCAVATFLTISLAVVMGLGIFADPIVRYCGVPAPLLPQAASLVRFFSAPMLALAMTTPAWSSVIFAHSRFDLTDLAQVTDVMMRAIGVVVLLNFTNLGLVGWCLAVLAAKMTGTTLTIALSHRCQPGLKARPSLVDRRTLVDLFSLGGMVSLRQMALRVSQSVEPLLVSAFLGPAAVSFYDPAQKLFNAPWPFVTGVARQFTPLVTGSHAAGDDAGVREILFRGTRLTFGIGVLAVVMMVAFAHPAVFVWLGPGRETTSWILMVGGCGQLMYYALGSQWGVMLGKNQVRYFTVVQISAAAVNVGAALLLVWLASHRTWPSETDRLLACSLAVVFPGVVIRAVERSITSRHAAHACGTSFRRYFMQSYARPVVTMLVLAAVAWGIDAAMKIDSWPRLIAAALVVSGIWALLCWSFIFDDVDRQRARSVFGRRRRAGDASPSDAAAS